MPAKRPFDFDSLESRLLYAAAANDTDFSQQTDLASINIANAWKRSTGNLNVVVADIDTGIDYTHPDLYANVWINPGEIPDALRKTLRDVDGDGRISFYDLDSKRNRKLLTDVNGNGVIDAGDLLEPTKRGGWDDGRDSDGNGYIDDIIGWDFAENDNNPFDYVGHGTHTAGTIAATRDNDYGIAGIAKTSLMIVKIFNDDGSGGTDQQIASAIRYSADNGARVSNNSWGYQLGFDPYYSTQTDAIYQAIAYAGSKGQIFVAAAGNDATNNDFSFFGSYPASYGLDNIVSVAAADNAGQLSYFSNFGTFTVDLAAPGQTVLSTYLKHRFATLSGTSMATPHVTGTIALMLAKYPKLTTAQVKGDLIGSVDVNASLYSDLVSGGALNAGDAVYLAAVQRSQALGHDSGASDAALAIANQGGATTSVFSNASIATLKDLVYPDVYPFDWI